MTIIICTSEFWLGVLAGSLGVVFVIGFVVGWSASDEFLDSLFNF